MREFLDNIFEWIESESLTDEEFETVDEDLSSEYTKDVYLALRSILESRENVSGQTLKLKKYFESKGVGVSTSSSTPTPNSNILIGGCL
jgi:hypothetical protein